MEKIAQITEVKTANRTIWSLALVSVVYCCLCIWLLIYSKSCSATGVWLIGTHLTCLDPNAIGDLFAGIFAPLAFLWLFGAVLIQSKELKAQRQELALTRDEMKLARETQIEQVKEMRASTEFIGIQTKIAEQQHETRIKEIKDLQYEKLKFTIFDYLKNFKNLKVGEKSPITEQFYHLETVSINGKNEILKELISQVFTFRERTAEGLANKGYKAPKAWFIDGEAANYMRNLLNVIKQVNILKKEISKNSLVDYHFHQFEELHIELEKVLADHTFE